ncbi:MAG: hypothetical protein WBN02_05840 [Sedimenticolaceae bacterium]
MTFFVDRGRQRTERRQYEGHQFDGLTRTSAASTIGVEPASSCIAWYRGIVICIPMGCASGGLAFREYVQELLKHRLRNLLVSFIPAWIPATIRSPAASPRDVRIRRIAAMPLMSGISPVPLFSPLTELHSLTRSLCATMRRRTPRW